MFLLKNASLNYLEKLLANKKFYCLKYDGMNDFCPINTFGLAKFLFDRKDQSIYVI